MSRISHKERERINALGRSLRTPMNSNDEQLGMAWWNGLSRPERMRVIARACGHKEDEDASVADAYQLWRQGVISAEPSGCGDCDPCLGGRPDQCAIGGGPI